ncbi:MAG: 16S rRNA (cytidine(1402)-2'-O)-methyltransferase [Gammaproteobacteria bacterium]
MAIKKQNQGVIYVVATPIGNLSDFSLRAQEILTKVDLIAAEDTRHSSHLLAHFNIQKPLIAYHEYNEPVCSKHLLDRVLQGENIALISDAGTPLISDPGFRLVQQAKQMQIKVIPIPGPCAIITALSASGLACDRFVFEGFLPAQKTQRIKHLQTLISEKRTIIFYESPHRILKSLEDMEAIFGSERSVVIARELTKKYETIKQDTLIKIIKFLKENEEQQKGEFVVLISGTFEEKKEEQNIHWQTILNELMTEIPLKQAVALTDKNTKHNKNQVYKYALEKNK